MVARNKGDRVKTIKFKEFVDAIEKNGLEHITDNYILFNDEDKPVAGCALGQAMINLELTKDRAIVTEIDMRNKNWDSPTQPSSWLETGLHNFIPGLASHIINMNDETDMSLPEIAQKLRTEYKDHLNLDFNIPETQEEVNALEERGE